MNYQGDIARQMANASSFASRVSMQTGVDVPKEREAYGKPIPKKMVFRDGDEKCPHCGAILRNYEGLSKCYCKFCGGMILR